jgi:ribosome biogenesis GTPase
MVTPSDVGAGEAAVAAPAPGMIEEVDPRRTVLRRGHDLERGHIVCANVDCIFIVVAMSNPPYNRSFIDRLIVGVERDALFPVVVVNKIDLADRESQALAARDMEVYGALGYSALLVSAATGEGIDAVREAFRGRISAVVGPSGVGKSSLLNLVSPGASLLIGRVSDHDGRGRHTTTAAELLPLVDGPEGRGFVIDTPGLGDFGLGDISADELMAGFREVARAAVECRHEPGTGRSLAARCGGTSVEGLTRRYAAGSSPRRDHRRSRAGATRSLSLARECQARVLRRGPARWTQGIGREPRSHEAHELDQPCWRPPDTSRRDGRAQSSRLEDAGAAAHVDGLAWS